MFSNANSVTGSPPRAACAANREHARLVSAKIAAGVVRDMPCSSAATTQRQRAVRRRKRHVCRVSTLRKPPRWRALPLRHSRLVMSATSAGAAASKIVLRRACRVQWRPGVGFELVVAAVRCGCRIANILRVMPSEAMPAWRIARLAAGAPSCFRLYRLDQRPRCVVGSMSGGQPRRRKLGDGRNLTRSTASSRPAMTGAFTFASASASITDRGRRASIAPLLKPRGPELTRAILKNATILPIPSRSVGTRLSSFPNPPAAWSCRPSGGRDRAA